MRTATIPIRTDGRTIDFVLADDLPTLVWLANLADLELHTSLARASDSKAPTILAFDLDPGEPATIVECARVALLLREAFEHLGLEGFPKTSGSKGMQVYVPLNTPATYGQTKPFALAIAQLLERRHPELVVSDMKKSLRVGKVLADWSQNDIHKTTVATYSLRAKARPTVSTPVTWDEVERCFKKKDPKLLVFETEDTLRRCKEMGDLFAPVLKMKQRLPALEALGIQPIKQRRAGGGTVKAAEFARARASGTEVRGERSGAQDAPAASATRAKSGEAEASAAPSTVSRRSRRSATTAATAARSNTRKRKSAKAEEEPETVTAATKATKPRRRHSG